MLRVGITGHRLDKLSETALDPLRERLRDLLAELEAAMSRFAARAPDTPHLHEAPECRLVSALAEGADRLAVDAAPAHWPIFALLPMPRDIYRHDFLAAGQDTSPSSEAFEAYLARAESVSELPMATTPQGAARSDRTAQYAALGRALVREIDCLVAVWDGKPPSGPGGTATVVAEAVERGLPVFWLEPDGGAPRQILDLAGSRMFRPQLGPVDEAAIDGILDRLLLRQREHDPAGRVTPPDRPS